MTIVCFHNPDEENGYLSNWYLSEFTVEGVRFSSMEQYMMYKKAMMFKDAAITEKIMATDNVSEIKAFGREVSNYNDTVWSGCRQIIVYNGLLEKFRQNTELKERLLSTGDAMLAECAVKDKVWGIGISMNDPDRLDVEKWQGSNLLGFALMEVRESVKRT